MVRLESETSGLVKIGPEAEIVRRVIKNSGMTIAFHKSDYSRNSLGALPRYFFT